MDPVTAAMWRRMEAAYIAATAMGLRCDQCNALLRPNDTGYDLDGGTLWIATCCGQTLTYREVPNARL